MAYYVPVSDRGLLWNDPDMCIAWPDFGQQPLNSAKDAASKSLRDAEVFEKD